MEEEEEEVVVHELDCGSASPRKTKQTPRPLIRRQPRLRLGWQRGGLFHYSDAAGLNKNGKSRKTRPAADGWHARSTHSARWC